MARYLGRHTIGIDQRTGKKVRHVDLVEDGENRGLLTTREERDREHPQKFARLIPADRLTIRRPSPEPMIGAVTIIGNSGGSADLWEGNQTALHLALIMGEVVVTPAAGLAPVSTIAPVISGTPRQGGILSTDNGSWDNTPLSYTFQWYADDVAIPSATSSSYLVDPAYVGSIMHVVVTATNNNGSASRASDDTAVVEGGFGLTPGSIILTGQSVALRAARKLLVTESDIAVSGSSVSLVLNRKLAVTSKNIAVAGSSVTLGQTPVDPDFSSVSLLLGFNGTDAATSTTDESPSPSTPLTFNGNAQLDTAQKKFGTASFLVDGTGDWLTVPHAAKLQLTDQFTVELWVRFNSVAGCSFISKWISTLGLNEWTFNYSSPNLTWWLYRSNVATQVSGAWSPSANTWYALCADRDSNGHTRVYVDGAMIAKNTTITGTLNSSTTAVNVGRQSDGTAAFNGWIDEVRITKGVARYASDGGYTVTTTAFARA